MASKYRPSAPPRTFGERLKAWRSERGLAQRYVAAMLGVRPATYGRWERDQRRPAIRHLPRIVGLLGLRPSRNAEALSERLRAARRWRGLTQGELAALVGVDRRTLGDWERGVRSPGMEGPAAIEEALRPPVTQPD